MDENGVEQSETVIVQAPIEFIEFEPVMIDNIVKVQISFKDQNDNMVILNEPPKRVAMFPIPHASLSIAIDAGPKRLITINPTAKKALSEHILKLALADADEVIAQEVLSIIEK